jgi:hypothetical protein
LALLVVPSYTCLNGTGGATGQKVALVAADFFRA